VFYCLVLGSLGEQIRERNKVSARIWGIFTICINAPEGCQRGTHGVRTHANTNTHAPANSRKHTSSRRSLDACVFSTRNLSSSRRTRDIHPFTAQTDTSGGWKRAWPARCWVGQRVGRTPLADCRARTTRPSIARTTTSQYSEGERPPHTKRQQPPSSESSSSSPAVYELLSLALALALALALDSHPASTSRPTTRTHPQPHASRHDSFSEER
jgi:hypothetical protein